MKSNNRVILGGTIALLLIALIVAVGLINRGVGMKRHAARPALNHTAEIGKRAPDFEVSTTQGLFDLDAARKPVFLEVFATWCPHCQRETAVLNRLYSQYHAQIAFVAVSGSSTGMDGRSPASQADVVRFAQRFDVRYPIAYDASLGVMHAYIAGDRGYPTFALIAPDKTIVYLDAGEVPYGDLSRAIAAQAGTVR